MPNPSNARIRTVEAVKGIAIALVVYGHVAQGAQHRGWWTTPGYFFQERYIYSFHMAAFFFVSGLFVHGSIAKFGPQQFVIQRLRTVLWPYIFCALGDVANVFIGQGVSVHAKGWVHGLILPVLTGESSWFLPTLFLCLLFALATDPLPAWVRFGLAVILCLLLPSSGFRILDSAARYFVFFAAGEWVARRIERVATVPRWTAFPVAVGLFFLVAIGNVGPYYSARIVVIILGLAGTGALILLASALRDTWFDSAAAWCGAASLGIFVLHPFFQGATRILMARVSSSHAILPNVAIPTIVSILGPGLLWHYREPLHIGFLFAFPWGEPKREKPSIERKDAALAAPVSSD